MRFMLMVKGDQDYEAGVPPLLALMAAVGLTHLTIGIVAPTLLMWGLASAALWLSKKAARQPAVA